MSADSSEVVKATPLFNDDVLGEIGSFSDALALLNNAGIPVVESSDFGSGFSVVEKSSLVGIPFVIVDARLHDGDYGVFAILHVVTEDGRKGIINDGSTGIRAQVEIIARKNGTVRGVMVRRGLSVSEYDYVDEKGKSTPAKTYYLN